ncbi:cupin-like domain-containing protein [Corallococcus sp. EGB]|uniref:cupin-like domain-containing protein n=1 Tax=Corallococcus sp. EGB TaxID=1521117 RepID=UPI001CBD86BD|nr:cupin-like domain-containing protein [Corallococcus sp. EGB]
MSASRDVGAGASPLTPEWRRWLVENLVRGVPPEDLVASLEKSGVDAEQARRAVEVEQQEPFVAGALRAVGMQRKLEGLLDVYAELFQQTEGPPRVDRHEALTPEAFFDRYYFDNLPVVLRAGWSASLAPEVWSPGNLAALLGEREARHACCVPLFEDSRLEPLSRGLTTLRGLTAEEARACEPRLWWEPPGTEVPLRAARRNVLLAQVHGERRLQLIPAFELRRVTVASSEPRDAPLCLDVTLSPGDLVLLPVGWWYGFSAPGGGAAVSFEAFALPEPNVTWDADAEPRPSPLPPRD